MTSENQTSLLLIAIRRFVPPSYFRDALSSLTENVNITNISSLEESWERFFENNPLWIDELDDSREARNSALVRKPEFTFDIYEIAIYGGDIRYARDSIETVLRDRLGSNNFYIAYDDTLFISTSATSVEFTPDLNMFDRYLQLSGVTESHTMGVDGDWIKIAVIDTGLSAQSPLVSNSRLKFCDFDQHPDGIVCPPNDTNGHGTVMASIISRVSPKSELIIMRVGGSSDQILLSKTLRAIRMALEYRVNIVNCSLEFHNLNQESLDLIQLSLKGEIDSIIVVATGNTKNSAIRAASVLCQHDNVTPIAAVNSSGRIASYSRVSSPRKYHFACFGGESTTTGGSSNEFFGQYKEKNVFGTSPACAFASGIFALLLSQAIKNTWPPPSKEFILERMYYHQSDFEININVDYAQTMRILRL